MEDRSAASSCQVAGAIPTSDPRPGAAPTSRNIRKGRTGLTSGWGWSSYFLSEVTVQQAATMIWSTDISDFDDFRRRLRDPDSLFLRGFHCGAPVSLTLSTIIEELDQIWVEGAGRWRAQVWRDGRQLRAAPLPRRRNPNRMKDQRCKFAASLASSSRSTVIP